MTSVTLIDRLPDNITGVTVDNGGVYDNVAGTVTWDIGTLNAGSNVTRSITFTYDDNFYTTSDTAINYADATGTPYGTSEPDAITDDVTHGFTDPVYTTENFRKSNKQNNEYYSVGQTVIYDIDRFGNTGNVPLENFYIEVTD